MFQQASWSTLKRYSSEIPRRLSRLLFGRPHPLSDEDFLSPMSSSTTSSHLCLHSTRTPVVVGPPDVCHHGHLDLCNHPWEMAMSPPRCARLFSPHSDFSQDVGARCSECPTGACSSQRKARSVSGMTQVLLVVGCLFKLNGLRSSRVGSCESRFRQNTAREGIERCHCSQRVMVPWRHFQTMRPSVSRREGQSPRYRETHGNGGCTSSIVGMLGPWCRLTCAPPPSPRKGRPTTNPTTGQAVAIF